MDTDDSVGVDDERIRQLRELARRLDVPLARVTPEWSVGEVSERTDISIDTLRYYERLGLIDPVARTSRGRRLYSDLDVERIGFVRRLRATGMPVETVAEYVRLRAKGPSAAAERLRLLREHRALLEHHQAELAQNAEHGRSGHEDRLLRRSARRYRPDRSGTLGWALTP